MALRCKPGDLAVIVRCEAHPENVGAFVTVVRPAEEPQRSWFECDWVIKPKCPLRVYNGFGMVIHSADETHARDSTLQPIRPPAQPESTNTTRDLEVTA